MRLLCPSIEKDRSKYGLKESSLAKLFINVLQIDASSADAQRLLKWKSSTSGSGEFSNVLLGVLKDRWTTTKAQRIPLTIEQVNEKLDEMAAIWFDDQAATEQAGTSSRSVKSSV